MAKSTRPDSLVPSKASATAATHLYGRETALADLEAAFRRACRGGGEIVLVPGPSGTGKTALVLGAAERIQDLGGWFVEGKFDQFQVNTPYSAIKSALAGVWAHMQAGADNGNVDRHGELVDRLGDLGPLLVHLVPALGVLWPDSPASEEINPHEARHRFAKAIRLFMEAACRPEHPVAMFVDDWQWADPASLDLLAPLPVGAQSREHLLVGADRADEGGAGPPMKFVLDGLDQQESPPRVVAVDDLTRGEIHDLVQDELPGRIEDLEMITGLVHDHTRGNPLFVRTFLGDLLAQGVLHRDAAQPAWRVDSSGNLPRDIVELFAQNIATMTAGTRELLSLVACLGNRFDLAAVAQVSERTLPECEQVLQPAFDAGLLVHDTDGEGRRARFLHDRVQQAAFLQIARDDVAPTRLKIGRSLLRHRGADVPDEQLFEILEHLNAGAALMDDRDEQLRTIRLNLNAAGRARTATAYGAMLEFTRAADHIAAQLDGGPGALWTEDYELALALSRDHATAEFLEGDRERAEAIVRESLPHTRIAIERAETLSILILNFTLLARYAEAIAAGRQALAEFGITLPTDDYEKARDEEIAEFRRSLQGREIAALADAPRMTDPVKSMAVRLLITMGPPCYRTHQRLWSVLVPKVVNLTIQSGLMPQVGYSHTAMGGLLAWVANDLEAGRELGDVATRIMRNHFSSPSDNSVFYLMRGSSTTHWYHHPEQSSQDYRRAFDIGAQSGNLQYAAYAFGHDMYCSFYRGLPLNALINQTANSLVFSRSRLNHWASDLLEGGLRVFRRLAAQPHSGPTAAEHRSQVREHGNIQVECIHATIEAAADLITGDFRGALAWSDEAEGLIATVGTQGLMPWPEHVATRLLILTALALEGDGDLPADHAADITRSRSLLDAWAACNPAGYDHRVRLISAELAQLDGDAALAASLYGQAIEAARRGGFHQWVGYAKERASRFWRSAGNDRLAQIYWQQAYEAYGRWGAQLKLRQMEEDLGAELASWLQDAAAVAAPGDAFADIAEAYAQACVDDLRRRQRSQVEARQARATISELEQLAAATEQLRREAAERKRAEDRNRALEVQLRQSQKMQAVGTLAGGIAHEFNNMLAVVTGSAELAQLDLAEGDFAAGQIQTILKASERMRDLVEKVLTFSRQENQAASSGDACDLVSDALALVAPSLPNSVTVRRQLDPATGHIPIGRTEMQQIVMNLASNATWAMAEKGTLLVEMGPVELRERLDAAPQSLPPGRYACLSVVDSGRGMDQATANRIFEPFFTGKEVGQGTGMGLAIVYGIMESAGGAIVVSSEPGTGTAFHLYFPLIDAVAANEDGQTGAAPGGHERIMLVDDEEMLVRAVAKMLDRLGYRTDVFTNATQALDRFTADPGAFDLVLVDQVMPALTGDELIRRMRAVRPDVPVIISTGYSSRMDAERAAAAGINAFATKPISIWNLARMVRRVLDEDRENDS